MLFVISDGFCRDVEDSSTTLNVDRCAVTRYVYDMMRSEYVHHCCHHYRSIPVLLPSTNCDNVPSWLKNSHLYLWPKHYKELFKVFRNCGVKLQCK